MGKVAAERGLVTAHDLFQKLDIFKGSTTDVNLPRIVPGEPP